MLHGEYLRLGEVITRAETRALPQSELNRYLSSNGPKPKTAVSNGSSLKRIGLEAGQIQAHCHLGGLVSGSQYVEKPRKLPSHCINLR